MTARVRCTGAILAGGLASRFGGTPKGLATVAGVRMIDRAVAALREATDEIMLMANDDGASSWLEQVPVHRDVLTGAGALGGIHAALVHGGTDIVVLPWDAPFVPGALLRELRAVGERLAVNAAVAASDGPWGFEPLVAWYSQRCLPAIARRIGAGDVRAGAWLDDVLVQRVDISRWGRPALLFYNVNTQDDLARAELLAAEQEDG